MSKIDHGLNLQWLTAGLIWFATWNGIILIVNLCYLSSLARQHSLQTLTLRYFLHETGNDDCTKNFPYWTLYLSYTSATDRMFTSNFLKCIKWYNTTKSLQIISNILWWHALKTIPAFRCSDHSKCEAN